MVRQNFSFNIHLYKLVFKWQILFSVQTDAFWMLQRRYIEAYKNEKNQS